MMTDFSRPDDPKHDWVDPERRKGAVTDDPDSYSGQAYTREGEEALGKQLPSGTVTSDPGLKPDAEETPGGK